MIDIKRLHKTHWCYPTVPRGMGKTTYCFDSLLRAAQTGYYKDLVYLTSTGRAAFDSLNRFREFLWDLKEDYVTIENNKVVVNNCAISFISEEKRVKASGVIEDLF